jgi:hypothetical protein
MLEKLSESILKIIHSINIIAIQFEKLKKY